MKRDPSLIYQNPNEVVTDSQLSKKQKLEILKYWEYDVRGLMVAEEENMGVGSITEEPKDVRDQTTSSLLSSILSAIRKIDPSYVTKGSTKHGGS